MQRNSAVAEYMSPKLGQWVGRVQNNKFTHRRDIGAEHWQMHRRALALQQGQRVKTNREPHCDSKKNSEVF